MKSLRQRSPLLLCLAPGFILYVGVVIFPALYTVYLSFTQWNGVSTAVKQWVGFRNYAALLGDFSFWQALLNNFKWIAMTLVITTTVSFCFALLLNHSFRGRTVFRGLFYFPYIISGVAVGIVWSWIYQPQFGLLKSLGTLLNAQFLKTPYLAQNRTALYAVFAAALWQGFGHPMTLFLSGLQTVPTDQLEAADIDGASRFQRLCYVTIPCLKETFVIIFSTLFINGLLVYDMIVALAGDGLGRSTTVISILMMTHSFRSAELGLGSATAVLMLLVLLVAIIPYMISMARNEG